MHGNTTRRISIGFPALFAAFALLALLSGCSLVPANNRPAASYLDEVAVAGYDVQPMETADEPGSRILVTLRLEFPADISGTSFLSYAICKLTAQEVSAKPLANECVWHEIRGSRQVSYVLDRHGPAFSGDEMTLEIMASGACVQGGRCSDHPTRTIRMTGLRHKLAQALQTRRASPAGRCDSSADCLNAWFHARDDLRASGLSMTPDVVRAGVAPELRFELRNAGNRPIRLPADGIPGLIEFFYTIRHETGRATLTTVERAGLGDKPLPIVAIDRRPGADPGRIAPGEKLVVRGRLKTIDRNLYSPNTGWVGPFFTLENKGKLPPPGPYRLYLAFRASPGMGISRNDVPAYQPLSVPFRLEE